MSRRTRVAGVLGAVLLLLGGGAVLLDVVRGAGTGGDDRRDAGPRGGGREVPAGFRPERGGPRAGVVTVASFNVLGADHTGPGGDSKPDWPEYTERLPEMVDMLDEASVGVAGLQELQKRQWALLRSDHGDTWGVFPRTDTVVTANTIVWRRADWTLVRARQFDIPYFGGVPQAQAWATLRQRSTGRTLHLVNVHNPYDLNGSNERYRARALRIERRLVQRLATDGSPVFLVGDFNEVTDPHCVLTRAGMTNAFGDGGSSPCRPPGRAGIDQVFTLGVDAGPARVDTAGIRRQVADHPLVTVRLPGGRVPG